MARSEYWFNNIYSSGACSSGKTKEHHRAEKKCISCHVPRSVGYLHSHASCIAQQMGSGLCSKSCDESFSQRGSCAKITEESTRSKDVEQGNKVMRRNCRAIHWRLLSYFKNMFSGVKFSSSDDDEMEDLEILPRYKPDSLTALCRATRFSENEIKKIYRGFKSECPTGVVKEDAFKIIYGQFFPNRANTGLYAHYIFNTLDHDHSGLVSFEEFIHGLSTLSRGTVEEKLRWTFSLYDINGDGKITREELAHIVTAVYELMGRIPGSSAKQTEIKVKADNIFQKLDANNDGVVRLDEFLECCQSDEAISTSLTVFDTVF